MSAICQLPPLVLLEEHDGDWNMYNETVYGYFRADFLDRKATFMGLDVRLRIHPMDQNKVATYWHLVSEGKEETERIPDMRRCERIRWPRVMIDHASANPETSALRVWENERHGAIGTVIAVKDFSYKVVLTKRTPHDGRPYYLLSSAYYIQGERQRQKHQAEFETYRAMKKTSAAPP